MILLVSWSIAWVHFFHGMTFISRNSKTADVKGRTSKERVISGSASGRAVFDTTIDQVVILNHRECIRLIGSVQDRP